MMAENRNAFPGTCVRESLLNLPLSFDLPPYVSENSIRPVVNNELLHAETAAVKTTKLIIVAAERIPIAENT